MILDTMIRLVYLIFIAAIVLFIGTIADNSEGVAIGVLSIVAAIVFYIVSHKEVKEIEKTTDFLAGLAGDEYPEKIQTTRRVFRVLVGAGSLGDILLFILIYVAVILVAIVNGVAIENSKVFLFIIAQAMFSVRNFLKYEGRK